MHLFASIIWWMALAVFVLAFLDLIPRTVGPKDWIARATRQRVMLGILEVGLIIGWLFVRGQWSIMTPANAGVALAGAVLALAGALLAAWAKVRLGRLFSPQLGVQTGHTLVTDGPYAVVRHPIYLGIVDFIAGTALFLNDAALLVVAGLFVLFFAMQLRIEERFFAAHFGGEWDEYRQRTPALMPRLLPRRQRAG